MLDLLSYMMLGIIAGCCTGMIPGLHINLVSALLISRAAFFEEIVYVEHLAVFVISMSITHTFIDSIPSIYLGAPDASQFLTALPGHKMFMQGKAHMAVTLTTFGSLLGLILSLSLLGMFTVLVHHIYSHLSSMIGHILLILSLYIIYDPGSLKNSLKRFMFFVLSGSYGMIILGQNQLSNPMFHMLSGLFGLSILVESLRSESDPVEQQPTLETDGRRAFFPSLTASISGFFAAFMPGFSTSQNAVILTRIFKKMNETDFLVLLGALNTSGMVASMGSFFAIERARNGSIIAIQELVGALHLDLFIVIVLVMLIAGSFASVVALRISRLMSKLVVKINYKQLILSVIISIAFLSFLFDGILGLFVLFFCTMTGLSASYSGVAKNYLMGCIMLPVIFFLFI